MSNQNILNFAWWCECVYSSHRSCSLRKIHEMATCSLCSMIKPIIHHELNSKNILKLHTHFEKRGERPTVREVKTFCGMNIIDSIYNMKFLINISMISLWISISLASGLHTQNFSLFLNRMKCFVKILIENFGGFCFWVTRESPRESTSPKLAAANEHFSSIRLLCHPLALFLHFIQREDRARWRWKVKVERRRRRKQFN